MNVRRMSNRKIAEVLEQPDGHGSCVSPARSRGIFSSRSPAVVLMVRGAILRATRPSRAFVPLPYASSLWRVRAHELLSDHLIILDGELAGL